MKNPFNKMLTDMLGKMDEKVLQAKLNAALDMLKKGDTDELAKKIVKMDKQDLMEKVNSLDMSKLNGLDIDLDEIKSKVTDADLEKLSAMIGENGDDIVNKLKKIINP